MEHTTQEGNPSIWIEKRGASANPLRKENHRFWDASADAADSAETESPPAGQTRTNRACFPDDARSTRQTPSNYLKLVFFLMK